WTGWRRICGLVKSSAVILQEIDKRAQRRGHMAAAWIIEKRSGKRLPPRLKNRLQRAAVEMRTEHVFEQMDDAHARDGRADGEVHRRAGPHEQRSGRIQLHHFA